MQKLTIPTLIFLLLTASLSADEAQDILLDKEILYWRPQGADILLPEVFYSPPMETYPDGAWKTSLIPLLTLPEESSGPGETESAEPALLTPDWQPPGLSLGDEEQSPRNQLCLYASKPYGIGLNASGYGEWLGYELEANGAVDDDYPHWGLFALNGTPGIFTINTAAGIRRQDGTRGLSYLKGGVSLGGEGANQNIYMRWKSDSRGGDSGFDENSWGVLGGYQITLFPGDFQLDAEFEGESLSGMSFNAYRLSQDISLKRTLSLSGGDLLLKGTICADLYPENPEDIALFPGVTLSYLRYDDFSLGLKYANESMDEELLFRFLLNEAPVEGDFGFYRWHRASLNWSGQLGPGRGSLEGGARFGDMPGIDDGILSPEKRILYFTNAEWTLPAGKGMITEFMVYADYEDTGSFRFLGKGAWIISSVSGRVYELSLRAGERILARGYESLLSDSSSILTGVGGAVEFSPLLKLEGNLDYVPRMGEWEGSVSLVCRY